MPLSGFGLPSAGGANVRHPRCWVEIGGARIPCLKAEVQRRSRRRADTFTVELSITLTERYGYGLDRWTDYEPEDVSVIMASAVDGSDERVMMTGLVDKPEVRLADMTVTLSGRDKSASLIERRRNEKQANQKPEDIVRKIAKDHGLTAEVNLPSASDFAGKTYDQDTAHLILNRTDYEVLSDLAEREGCRWYVDGDTLYFEPDDQANGAFNLIWQPPGTQAAYTVANVLDLSLGRNMSAARPHTMRVKSWHHRSRKLFKAESTIPGVGAPIEYEDHHSGRNQAQVEKLAKARAKNAARHELGIVAHCPGDLSVDVRQKLNLSGTGTIFDQDYDVDAVDFDITWGEGFTMNVQANAAKRGRDVSVTGSSIGGKSVNQDGPATKTVPLPPTRPGGTADGGTET